MTEATSCDTHPTMLQIPAQHKVPCIKSQGNYYYGENIDKEVNVVIAEK
jgi:hypothetical protein